MCGLTRQPPAGGTGMARGGETQPVPVPCCTRPGRATRDNPYSPLQKSSHVAKLAGPNTFVGSICLSASALVVLVLNLIPYLAVGTSTQKGKIMTMQK